MGRPTKTVEAEIIPMLKNIEQMSRLSGIGENRLRELIDKGEIDYVQIGCKKLIADQAIWDWYNRCAVRAVQV